MDEYEVGDEVVIWDKRFVITRYVEGTLIYVLSEVGIMTSFDYIFLQQRQNIYKTGRKFPQIAEVMKSLEDPVE